MNKRSILATLLLVGSLSLAVMPPAKAQTNPPPEPPSVPSLNMPFSLDLLTNIPSTTNFASATLGLETGIATKNGNVANFIKADYYLKTNWMISGEIQNAPVSTVIDSLSLYAGYRKAWSNAEIYAQAGIRRTWSTASEPPSWQGGLLFGASWFPMTGGKVALTISDGITTSARGHPFASSPGNEFRAGAKLLF